jgi:hypothetical protein
MFTLLGFGRATRPFAARILLFGLERPRFTNRSYSYFICCSASRGINDIQNKENPQKNLGKNLRINKALSLVTDTYSTYRVDRPTLKLIAIFSQSFPICFLFFFFTFPLVFSVFLFTFISSLHLFFRHFPIILLSILCFFLLFSRYVYSLSCFSSPLPSLPLFFFLPFVYFLSTSTIIPPPPVSLS